MATSNLTSAIYLGAPQASLLTNMLSNGALTTNTTGWTINSSNSSTIENNSTKLTVTTQNSSFIQNYCAFTSTSGTSASTKQILYCQIEVCGKPTNTNSPRGIIRQYKNGSSTATYAYLTAINSSATPVCNFSSINMDSIPSGGYAYATINNGTTQYTSGSIPITYGDQIQIHMERTTGNSGVYLYQEKASSSQMPDYHEYSSALTYTWDTSTVPYNFSSASIVFENEDSGYLNCTIKIEPAWEKHSAYLTTYDGTDYFSFDRAIFSLAPAAVNDVGFFKNFLIINLTTKFTRDNEPTKDWCDERIKFINDQPVYISDTETAHSVSKVYIGVNNVAKQVVKGYIGVNGVARLFYEETPSIQKAYSLANQGSYGWSTNPTLGSPSTNNYDGVYTNGNSSTTTSTNYAITKITFSGYTTFKVYIANYGTSSTSSNSYVIASQVDAASYPTSYSGGTVQAHTRNKYMSSTSGTSSISNYTEVTYDNLDGGEHFIYIVYRRYRNASNVSGYFLIDKTT